MSPYTVICRIPFVYVYVSCGWIMWLLVKYYSAYVILRQRFLTSGEASINEWHEQYMQGSLDKTGKEEGKGVLAALKHFKQLFDPSEVSKLVWPTQKEQAFGIRQAIKKTRGAGCSEALEAAFAHLGRQSHVI